MTKKVTSNVKNVAVKLIILILALVALYFGGKFAFETGYKIMGKSPESDGTVMSVEITIPQGASSETIAKILKENDLIGSVLYFRIIAKMAGNDSKFQFGTFELNTGMDEEEIMSSLIQNGQKMDTVKFTIPEGYTIEQIATKLEAEGIVDSEEFMEAVLNVDFGYKFIKDIPQREILLQGYLFPNTYDVYKDATASDVISTMLKEFNRVFKDEYYTRAEELGLTVDEVITIASIIEKEVRLDTERATVSGVIYNRLDIDMRLEMCSTVIYALDKPKDFNKNKLLYTDLETDSPYNTYMYSGLPVGPIANPGEASIKAALYPEEHDYLFFVLVNEETGEHKFNTTLDGHNAAKNQYKQEY
ncbi:MAG: endolytic transglycosylase MltG [Firmicutes bacterium HGW-Firmicutes-7]|nr:MAG: endolytic transglycosylase MltG [Firmicutes bacterium HGW-Firmicutes-7]